MTLDFAADQMACDFVFMNTIAAVSTATGPGQRATVKHGARRMTLA
jgi:hypothetical protein